MNTNEVRWHLNNYWQNKNTIKKLQDNLKEKKINDGVGCQHISDMPTGSRKHGSVVDKLSENIDGNRQLEIEIERLVLIDKTITRVYSTLNEIKVTFLELRYFLTSEPTDVRQRKYTMPEISERLNYSIRGLEEMDKRIVKKIQNLLHSST